jgi:hypothetical protein
LPTKPEAFSRVLIDQALRESGWDLLDDRRVRFELDGRSGASPACGKTRFGLAASEP